PTAPPSRPTGRARIELSSRPSGATLYDAAGRSIGTTPTTLDLPADGQPVRIILRHPMAVDEVIHLAPTGDARVELELAPRRAAPSPVEPRDRADTGPRPAPAGQTRVGNGTL